MNLTIEKAAQGGRGIARLPDGRICFVAEALPGETVSVRLLREKKDYAEAQTLEVITATDGRCIPKCPLYNKCGGCNLQHANIETQVAMHRQVVEELFRRFAKTELPSEWPLHCGEPWAYRNRVRWNRVQGGWGFRSRSSHEVVAVSQCPVLIGELNAFAAQIQIPSRVRELEAFAPGDGSIAYWHEGMRDLRAAEAWVPLQEKKISMDASVFFQSNLGMLPQLLDAVMVAAGNGEHAVDLFSGVGLFALFLQDRFAKVSAVEREPGCLRHARRHLGANCQYVTDPAEKWLADAARLTGVDCVVVDPPRTGLPPGCSEAIAASQTPKLVYVSCDPVTLARDTAKLQSQGFRLADAQGFAFYPQTSHFEMMAVFVRDSSR